MARNEIKFGKLTIPVPKWCVAVFGILAVVYMVYAAVYEPAQTVYSRYLSGTAQESDIAEAYKHFADTPVAVVTEDAAGGKLEAKLFRDGCVSVAWQNPLSGMVPRPRFIRKITESEGPPQSVRSGDLFVQDAVASSSAASCLNPHPGEFTWRYGERNGCWVKILRIFTDGCEHSQWLNSCNNTWDTHADGTPHVEWTKCVHSAK